MTDPSSPATPRPEVLDAVLTLSEADRTREGGDEVTALRLYRRAAERAAAVFGPDVEARALLGAGEMLALQDRVAEADRALHEAIARAMEAGDATTEARAWFVLATLAFDQGRSKDGHDALLEAMALYRDLDTREGRLGLAQATRTYGEHLAVLGSATDAREALRLARAMYEALGDTAAVAGIDADLATVAGFAR